MDLLNGVLPGNDTPKNLKDFANASNILHLIGSQGVLDALHDFNEDACKPAQEKTPGQDIDNLTKLVREIRVDLRIPGTAKKSKFKVQLRSSGTRPQK